MLKIHPQYLKDANGKESMVVLSVKDFKAIIEELEDAEDVRLYDEAKKDKETSIPIDEAFKMMETKRKQNNDLQYNLKEASY